MKKKKVKPPYNADAAIRGALRKTFARSPAVIAALKAVRREMPRVKLDGTSAKRPHVQYQCAVCLDWYGSTKVSVDHVDPVISTDEGFIDWNTFIERLFCDPKNLQVICECCHKTKTYAERVGRLNKQYNTDLDKITDAALENPAAIPQLQEILLTYIAKKKVPAFVEVGCRAEELYNIISGA